MKHKARGGRNFREICLAESKFDCEKFAFVSKEILVPPNERVEHSCVACARGTVECRSRGTWTYARATRNVSGRRGWWARPLPVRRDSSPPSSTTWPFRVFCARRTNDRTLACMSMKYDVSGCMRDRWGRGALFLLAVVVVVTGRILTHTCTYPSYHTILSYPCPRGGVRQDCV